MSYLVKRRLAITSVLDKKKKVNDEISLLKNAQDIEDRKLAATKEALEKISLELDELETLLDGSTAVLEEYVDNVVALVVKGTVTVQEAEAVLDKYGLAIDALETRVAELRQSARDINRGIEEKLEALAKEDARLVKFNNDLKIYAKRLEKKIKDAGVDIKIIEPD